MSYSGATTPHLVITAATAAQNGYKFRCRVTNQWGAATSASAELTVNSAGCTWTPLANDPLNSIGLTDQGIYAASYVSNNTPPATISDSLVGTAFSSAATANNNTFPPGASVTSCSLATAITFGSSGAKSFNCVVSLLAGAYDIPFSGTQIGLYSMDGMTLYDSATDPSTGDMNTNLSLTVPSAGQYMILFWANRAVASPGSNLQFELNHTMAGDETTCTIV